MDDIEIVKKVKDGDIEAFSFLVKKYHKNLLNFIFKLHGDRELIEDIGQEIFLKAYISLESFDATKGVPFVAWLFIIARNHCITELRKRHGKQHIALDAIPELPELCKSAEEKLLEDEYRQILESSLVQLPEPYKSTILRSLKGDSIKKIARTERISQGTVKSRFFRARERMKGFIKKYFEDRVRNFGG